MKTTNFLLATVFHLCYICNVVSFNDTMNKFFGLHLDFAGAITAMICAVHCTIVPIVLSLGWASNVAHSHTFDFLFMSIGVIIAGYVLLRDYSGKHGSFMPSLIALLGFITLFVGIETHGHLPILNIIGGLMIVFSHLYNWKLSHGKRLA